MNKLGSDKAPEYTTHAHKGSTVHLHLILNRNILFIYTHTPCHSLMLSHINHYSQTLGILPTTVLKEIKPVYRKPYKIPPSRCMGRI